MAEIVTIQPPMKVELHLTEQEALRLMAFLKSQLTGRPGPIAAERDVAIEILDVLENDPELSAH